MKYISYLLKIVLVGMIASCNTATEETTHSKTDTLKIDTVAVVIDTLEKKK